VEFDVIDQLLIRYSVLFRHRRKKWRYNRTVYYLFVDFKKAYDVTIEIGVRTG
jgi:hypothetical protein